jgi:gliding motility-associated-like protein
VTTRPLHDTIIYVDIINQFGCRNRDSIQLFVLESICAEPYVFVPTAFSPNNDGHNDVLYVRGTPITEIYFTIYNRWGEKIFETTQLDKGWDGYFKNALLPPDVYGFYLTLKCFGGKEYFKKGNITLLR